MGAAGGAVTLFERERESDAFRRTRRARCEGGGAQAVGSLAVRSGPGALACTRLTHSPAGAPVAWDTD